MTTINKKISDIDPDDYFIRLSDNKTHYLHPEGDNYKVMEGHKGAAVFHKQNALNLIEECKLGNVEIVQFHDVVGHEGTGIFSEKKSD